ncbi:MAG: hypothetical protein J5I93_08495 [Pirellulaceae bacterium]|nr:hypothetical protein [Pirellulaceae bacterium]
MSARTWRPSPARWPRFGRRPLRWPCAALAGLLSVLSVLGSAAAHEGPPFPIVVDQTLGEYTVSVWADPDIGTAQFFVILESPAKDFADRVPRVALWVEPVSGRLPRVTCPAEQQAMRNRLQFEARPVFDQRDQWRVGVQLTASGGETQELTMQVESTPPGYGAWDLAIYLFPFVLLGGLWAVAMLRRSAVACPHDAPIAEPPRESVLRAKQTAPGPVTKFQGSAVREVE